MPEEQQEAQEKKLYPKVVYGPEGHRTVANKDEETVARKAGFHADSPDKEGGTSAAAPEAAAKKKAD